MSRSLALALVFSTATAWAEPSAPQEQEPNLSRFSLTYGGGFRGDEQNVDHVRQTYGGTFQASQVNFAGAWFFKRWLGVALNVQGETFAISSSERALQLFGVHLDAAAVGRWSPRYWLGLELHVGISGGLLPGFTVDTSDVTRSPVSAWGPSLGLVAAFENDGFVGGQLSVRAMAGVGSHAGVSLVALRGSLDGQLFLGNLAFGDLRAAGVLEAEVVGAGGGNGGPSFSFGQSELRFTAGIRIRLQSPPPPPRLATLEAGHDTPDTAVVPVKPTGPGTVRGLVKSDKPDVGIEGAEVTMEGRPPVKTAADGSFKLDKAGPGPVKVTVKAKGFANGEEVVQVPPEAEAKVTLVLAKVGDKAPATIRGLVRTASGKAVKATVRINELNLKVAVKADGRFVVQVPGGKYTLVIEAPGFVAQAKALDVADGDQAIFHCDLQPATR